MRRNAQAALLAAVSGVLLLLGGYTGRRPVNQLFLLLQELAGPGIVELVLLVLTYVFVGIASLGGLTVLFGGYMIWNDRVRFGRVLILIGSGAGFFTLLVFLFVNLRRAEFDLLTSVLPAVFGVFVGILARFRAKPKPVFNRR